MPMFLFFGNGWGDDIITDFANDGLEKIDFSNSASINSMDDLAISYADGNALASTFSGSITLEGITSGIDVNDFNF